MSTKNDSSEIFNIKEFLVQVLSNKFFYLTSLILFLSGAYLYNRFTPVVYEVNSIIGPVDDRRTSLIGSGDLFTGMGAFSDTRNLENDMNSLKSFTLISETVKKLNLETGYFMDQQTILDQPVQLYNSSPYTVTIDKSHIQPINSRFYIDILSETSYRLRSSELDVRLYNYLDNKIVSYNNVLLVDTVCSFNETISNPNFRFSITLNREFLNGNLVNPVNAYFEFYHLDHLARNYLRRLRVEPVSTRSSLIKAFFQGENTALTIDFLNTYLETYLDDNLAKKNKISVNTVNFIDSQISEISDSLDISESKLSDYRSANQVTDLSYQGQQALTQMTQIENELSTLQVQERYYNYVLDYFSNNQDLSGLAPPSVANVADPLMNTLVLELLTLNAERATILSSNAEKNLFLGQIENRMRLQKQAIIENVTNNLNTLSLSRNELNYRSEKLSRTISRLPRTELNMLSMQRKFNLTDAIYTFLLQKRSEAAITMASNYPDYEILEPARTIYTTVLSPRRMINYMIALFIGFMFPTIFIILRKFFNETVSAIRDAEYLLERPTISHIFTNLYKTEAVVPENPASYISESFRNLRTNLFLKLRSEPQKVIMITSSQPGDGKSFVSFNLAASIASVGHKVVILDCDLRRPTLHKKFRMENLIGLSNFMADHMTKEDIIIKSDVNNLFFIPAGPVMPNSSEKIESGALDKLIHELKNQFDYVIFDTTPAGVVADASLMIKYTTHILLVCRNNYTRKDVFLDVLNLFLVNNVNNYDVVYNDLNLKKSRHGRYNAYYK